MSLFPLHLRLLSLVLVCGAVVLFPTTNARAEKVPRPPENKPANDKPPVNRTAEVFWGSKWYPVQVLEEKDGKFFVHYDTYTDASNEWVTKDRVRFPAKVKEEVARKAEVEWAGTWYPSQVLEEKDGKFHIKYDGYGDNWNEWVGKERIRFAEKPKKAEKPAPAKIAKQTKCEVLWSTTWYPAQVLETKDGKSYIKYDGYSDNWNEWVGPDRIRLLNTDKPAAKPGSGPKKY